LGAFRQMSPGEFEFDVGVFISVERLVQIFVHLGVSAIEGISFYMEYGIGEMGNFSTLRQIQS